MSKTIFAALAALALSTASVGAATVISGTYVVVVKYTCQPTLTAHFTNANIADAVSLSSESSFSQQILTATFNPDTGQYSWTGVSDEGSFFLVQQTGSQHSSFGEPMNEQPTSGTAPYSNTDNTVTLNGQVFNAIFSSKKGVAESASASSTYPEGDALCAAQFTATRQ